MTREEAESELMQLYGSLSEEKKKALDVAFKAIEQEPCEDVISRQALLKLMGEEPFNWTDSDKELQAVEDYRNFRNMVEQLPSVKPQDCDTCEVGNPCLYCKHEFKAQADGEYISRQAVIDSIDKWVKNMGVLIALPANEVTPLFDSIHGLPSVAIPSAEPKTGHWEWVQYDSNPNIGNWHCSECRTIIPHMPEETDNTPIYKWCPMCRAKMVEPQEGSEE